MSVIAVNPSMLEECIDFLGSVINRQHACAFQRLLGVDSPAVKLAVTLGRVANARCVESSIAPSLQRYQLLTTAAVHAARQWNPPPNPSFSDTSNDLPRPLEWMALALLSTLHGQGVTHTAPIAIGSASSALHAALAKAHPFLFDDDSPALCYAADVMLAVALGVPANAAFTQAGSAPGRPVRIPERAETPCNPNGTINLGNKCIGAGLRCFRQFTHFLVKGRQRQHADACDKQFI